MIHRKHIQIAALCLLIIGVGGCAQTVVQPKYEQRMAGLVVRPSQVLIYDFTIAATDVSENRGPFAAARNALSGTSKNDRALTIAQTAQNRMVEDLVAGIRALGLSAQRATPDAELPSDAVAVTGLFVKIDEGDQLQRVALGFGAGQSTVDAKVEVNAPSASGPTKLLEFSTHADSGTAPGALVTGGVGAAARGGMAVGAAAANMGVGAAKGYRSQVEQMTARSADQVVAYLSQYFAKQGWISQEMVKQARTSE